MSTDTESLKADDSEFFANNAEYFAQAFAALNGVYENSGPMNIVSEEDEMTVVVGVKETDADGAMDVDCVLLESDQESLRNCINTLFTEE